MHAPGTSFVIAVFSCSCSITRRLLRVAARVQGVEVLPWKDVPSAWTGTLRELVDQALSQDCKSSEPEYLDKLFRELDDACTVPLSLLLYPLTVTFAFSPSYGRSGAVDDDGR
jgi:hypothetical protein